MKKLIFSSVFIWFGSVLANSEVLHQVEGDETAWFLSEVYYGKGSLYPKILEANGLQVAEEFRPGMKLKIPNPQFDSETSEFRDRWTKMKSERKNKFSQIQFLPKPSKGASVVDQAKQELQSTSSRVPSNQAE